MKISKRQLKRIIREEYSRIKRQGLIRENLGGIDFSDIDEAAAQIIAQHGRPPRGQQRTMPGMLELSTEEVADLLIQGGADPREVQDQIIEPSMWEGADEAGGMVTQFGAFGYSAGGSTMWVDPSYR